MVNFQETRVVENDLFIKEILIFDYITSTSFLRRFKDCKLAGSKHLEVYQ
jgi:hypothetical protein